MVRKNRNKTKNNQLLMDFVTTRNGMHFSANDVYKHFITSDISMSIPTIYRQLDKMTQDGIIHKYRTSETDAAMYFYLDDESGKNYDSHMKCTECGKIYPLQCHIAEEFAGHVEDEHHFVIHMDETVFYGKCENCKN